MKDSTWLWVPRIAMIIYIAFLSLFSLDAFSTDLTFGEQILDFLKHSIPSLVLAAVLVFTWRNPMIAGFSFIIIGLIMAGYFQHYKRWDWFAAIDLPVILIGATFYIYHKFIRSKREDKDSIEG